MRIEVASIAGTPAKEKGDLLEKFAADFVQTQGYKVESQVRVTAVELDLLCKHNVSGRTLYVECKAHRDPLSANALTNLLGTITLKNYDEGWFISAGPLGKDAKGFQHEWEQRPPAERQKLSIYTPDRVIESFVAAGLIQPMPQLPLTPELPDDIHVGDWMLLITKRGRFWSAPTIEHGVPAGVLVLDAANNRQVVEISLLRALRKTDTTLATLDFEFGARIPPSVAPGVASISPENVVEVQHGDSWSDYRPARPEDFVGRKQAQDVLFALLEDVRRSKTKTRVFAITGDSGMGKSSLVAKLRARSRNRRHRRKYFLSAVDSRAATNSTYVLASLIKTLRDSAAAGFGNPNINDVEISDHFDPLNSESVKSFLKCLEEKKQVICLIFDQFEELYSKSELFPVFEESQRLFLSAISAYSNLVLGFAWRSDSTVQQDHPAYYMWHRLRDHRLEVALGPLSPAETERALTIFEKELGDKLRPEIRRQIKEASQGYPWLLKKICIHLFEQINSGVPQADLAETLDVRSLFDRDLQLLTQPENTCLRLVAQSAPADWYEVLEASDPDVLRALQDKRLVVRSGDRLNVYWDIFREYLLTSVPPSIPFSYIPSAPSVKSLLRVANQLSPQEGRSHAELAIAAELGEKTVGNVVRDLRMFGVAIGSYTATKLDDEMNSGDPTEVLERIRRVLKRHALTHELERLEQGASVAIDYIAEVLRLLNPSASHRTRTWRFYAERMANWLTAVGLLVPDKQLGWLRQDIGRVVLPEDGGRRRSHGVFTGDAPPNRVVDALRWISERSQASSQDVRRNGYSNAMLVLRRFNLVDMTEGGQFRLAGQAFNNMSIEEKIIEAASAEESVKISMSCIRENPNISGWSLGAMINSRFRKSWKDASKIRTGNALLRWARWIMISQAIGRPIPPLAGIRRNKMDSNGQDSLF